MTQNKYSRPTIVLAVLAGLLLTTAVVVLIRHQARPQTFTMTVSGPAGLKTGGFYLADGMRGDISGSIPFTVSVKCRRIEYTLVSLSGDPGDKFEARMAYDGRDLGSVGGSNGVKGGFDKKFVGFTCWHGGMQPKDRAAAVAALQTGVKDNK